MTKVEQCYRAQQRLYLEELGITQKVVADKADCSEKTVYNYLACKRLAPEVNAAIIELLAEARKLKAEEEKQDVFEKSKDFFQMTGKKNFAKVYRTWCKAIPEHSISQNS